MKIRFAAGVALIIVAFSLTQCTITNGSYLSDFKKTYPNAEALKNEYPQLETKRATPSPQNTQPRALFGKVDPVGSPYLKAHLKNGHVLVYSGSWWLDEEKELVRGAALRYGLDRRLIGPQDSVAWSDVSLFETNRPLPSNNAVRMSAMTVLLVADIAGGIICFTVEKACFGSCPTFYLDDSTDVRGADAEGFSNALLPSAAYADVDYLGTREVRNGTLPLTVKNEAMETHVIQGLHVYAIPVSNGEVALQGTDKKFYRSRQSLPLVQAVAQEGDITDRVATRDGNERWHPTDATNLAQKETLEFLFDATDWDGRTPLGINVDFRQSFVTTYLMYSAIGYLGTEYTQYLARAENSPKALNPLSFEQGIGRALGGLEMEFWNEAEQKWTYVDRFHETGPIAINTQTLPLPGCAAHNGKIRLRMRAAQGSWRLDCVALQVLNEEVNPIILTPQPTQEPDGTHRQAEYALDQPLSDSQSPGAAAARVNLPGTSYVQTFTGVVPDGRTALFLESKGYYLEWSRQSWLSYEDKGKFFQMVLQPERYLKQVAPEFKAVENAMEEVFWSTKQYSNPMNLSHED